MLKETESLAKEGFFDRIYIGALCKKGLKKTEDIDGVRRIVRPPILSACLPDGFPWKLFQLLEWELRIFFKFRKTQIAVFNAHTLTVLPLGVIFKRVTGAKLIYDAHELETEVQVSKIQKMAYKIIERSLICYADVVITVSESIAEWYRNTYMLNNVNVIYNIPYRRPMGPQSAERLRTILKIKETDFLFIHHGILEEGRGIGLLLECFTRTQSDRHIVLMGNGALEETILHYTMKYSNIHFLPTVQPQKVLDYVGGADVGIHLIENTCLNHYYCLPNKLFEFILAGVPAIVSDFPEMRRVVQDGPCGWTVPVDAEALRVLVDGITWKEVKDKKAATQISQCELGWHTEEKKLIEVYANLLGDAKGWLD
ncbi:MAG: glycosyltransferase [Deltaproteobacteria bacterium]